jgi:hypothetical protein
MITTRLTASEADVMPYDPPKFPFYVDEIELPPHVAWAMQYLASVDEGYATNAELYRNCQETLTLSLLYEGGCVAYLPMPDGRNLIYAGGDPAEVVKVTDEMNNQGVRLVTMAPNSFRRELFRVISPPRASRSARR